MSDAVHGLDLVVEAADGRREAVPVGDDELVAQGSGHQHDVVVDEAETVGIIQMMTIVSLLSLCSTQGPSSIQRLHHY